MLLAVASKPTMSNPGQQQTYIIHMDHSHKPASFSTHESWHSSTVETLTSSKETLLYSYNHAMHGFSARLTPSQLSELEKHPAHRSTYTESYGRLLTTHTPRFLGLKHSSGLWPDRWKGTCENGTEFSSSLCNLKLIGARSFSKGLQAGGIPISKDRDYDSARDFEGHGTHTASTAAGNIVQNVGHFGYATGTARGVAPGARIAMYKVFWDVDTEQSASSDVLAGMDQAIADGVDIMSLSLGFDQKPYFNDVVAIASLSAIEKGTVVVCAAGNDGPGPNTTQNGAPWIITVGAGTTDRSFVGVLTLANGLTVEGTSYFPLSIYITDTPIYYGKNNISKASCHPSALDQSEVKGKVVLCDSVSDIRSQMDELERVGALAGIFYTDGVIVHPQPEEYTMPSLILKSRDHSLVRDYVMSANSSTVKEMKFVITKIGVKTAPQVTYFSSRGPNPITPSILKPDILAPGQDVLAAVAPNRPFVEIGDYELVSDYALYSGTSMATPHVAGVAALLKATHSDWSPAAIRSAIMTTSTSKNNRNSAITDEVTGLPSTPLDFGAGHINPNKAMNPGLIYDMGFQDYVDFLCGLGYSNKQMSAVVRRSQWNCPQTPSDLNYPSFMVLAPNATTYPMVMNFTRVVTNVGDENSIYQAIFEVPSRMKIQTDPKTLTFTSKGQQQRFIVIVEIEKMDLRVTHGYLKWIDQHNHTVSSPVVSLTI